MSTENDDPTPVERLEAADGELAKLHDILTRLWLERHLLYGAIRDVKTLRHNLELARIELNDGEG
jgi:hypothetical protein